MDLTPTAREARTSALEATRRIYGSLDKTTKKLREYEESNIYTADHLEERRMEEHGALFTSINSDFGQARRSVEDARKRAEKRLSEAVSAEESQISAATARLGMILGDSLRSDPEQLLGLYENAVGSEDTASRLAIERLASDLTTISDSAETRVFSSRFTALKQQLEDRLPESEKRARSEAEEIEKTAQYLDHVETAVKHTLAREGGDDVSEAEYAYGVARHHAAAFEREAAGESFTDRHLPRAGQADISSGNPVSGAA